MQPSDRSGFFPSGQEPVDGQAARLEALGSQVAQAQAELEEYQRLLNELPGIYEGKFRQKLRSVDQEIRQLLNERKALQQQLGQALAETRQPYQQPFSFSPGWDVASFPSGTSSAKSSYHDSVAG